MHIITLQNWTSVFLGTSRIRPSWPRSGLRLSPTLASPHKHASCCHAQPGILLFIAAVQVSPQRLLLSGWLLTTVQVNITTTLHNTWHTRIYITLVLLFISSFYTSSIFLVRLAVLHSLRPLQYCRTVKTHQYLCKINTTLVTSYKKNIYGNNENPPVKIWENTATRP